MRDVTLLINDNVMMADLKRKKAPNIGAFFKILLSDYFFVVSVGLAPAPGKVIGALLPTGPLGLEAF